MLQHSHTQLTANYLANIFFL